MKRGLTKKVIGFLALLAIITTYNNAFALDASVPYSPPVLTVKPYSPVLTVSTFGLIVSISWTPVAGATGYTLYYAPSPYAGEQTIGNIDMGTSTSFSGLLWDKASFFVAVTSRVDSTESDYSNIELFTVAEGTQYQCVTINDLMWEVKANDGGLRDKSNTYKWFDPSLPLTYVDTQTPWAGERCSSSECDTYHYVQAVNAQGLCGYNDWRVPTKDELKLLVYCDTGPASPLPDNTSCNAGYSRPTINQSLFPNTIASYYWSASPNAYNSNNAWHVSFYSGYSNSSSSKYYSLYVRLVRSGQ